MQAPQTEVAGPAELAGPAEPAGPADLAGKTVLICGTGVAGSSMIRAMSGLVGPAGRILVTGDREPADWSEFAAGAEFLGDLVTLPDVDMVLPSPGVPPAHPLLAAATLAGLPVLGELELAWRLRMLPPGISRPADWLMVTGTNGKTTTIRMLESMLRAAGLRTLAVGNVGVPIIDAVLAGDAYDVLAVEASSFQLTFSSTIRPRAGVLLNLAEDHLDWHTGMADYIAQKVKVLNAEVPIGNADDPLVAELLAGRPAAQSFTLGPPAPEQFGIRDGWLTRPEGLDSAGADRSSGGRLVTASEIRPSGAHNVANALAAAALATAYGVSAHAIAAGLHAFAPEPHRNELVSVHNGVSFVDDSKATNPHAAAASLDSYPRVVWIAGGQLKGADVEELVHRFADRLVGAVLLGVDAPLVALALARHASHLPVISIASTDHGVMTEVVRAAESLAGPGDVVLLAPAAASKDMFESYAQRGDQFAAAVRALIGTDGPLAESATAGPLAESATAGPLAESAATGSPLADR